MISFYPGPSKIDPRIGMYLQEAVESGILSVNHRSPEFIEVSKAAVLQFKEKLNIPEEYSVFFTSSATEGWEITSQSLTARKSLHIFNGAFGEKWFSYASDLVERAYALRFGVNEMPALDDAPKDADVICLTHSETSNGTLLPNALFSIIREKFPQALIATDVTSSIGGLAIDFTLADIWIASVQKCLGLPAGMGIMICSPQALERAEQLQRNDRYNSVLGMMERMKEWQTTYTPNVLSIWLLKRVMEEREPIHVIDARLRQRAEKWFTVVSKLNEDINVLVREPSFRSPAIIAVEASAELVKEIKRKAKEEGLLIGNGYGEWKNYSFRIANFPAHSEEEIQKLQSWLQRHFS